MNYRKIVGFSLIAFAQVVFSQCFYNSPVNYVNTCTVYLNSVSINELNNTGNSCSGDVSDYSTNTSLKPTLYRGTRDTIFLQTVNGGFNQNVGIYIDWNGNNEYDSGEYHNFGLLEANNLFPKSYSFAVPNNAKLGDIRMRIRSVYFSQSLTENDLCTNGFDFGETEDYTINIADKDMTVSYTTMQPTDISYSQKGFAENQVLRIEVLGSGLLNPLKLDSLYFHFPLYVNKNNFSAAKIYKTNTDTFNSLSLVATLNNPSTTFAFKGLDQELSGGINYYWLALDLSTQATIGDTLDAVSDSIWVSGQKLLPFQNDPFGSIRVDYCKNTPNSVCDFYITELSVATNFRSLTCLGGYLKDSDFYDFNLGGTYFPVIETNTDCEVGFMLDLNQDGDFEDANEFTKLIMKGNTPTGFSFTIPTTTTPGRIRMRVFAAASINGAYDACFTTNLYDADWLVDEALSMYVYDVQVRQYEKRLVASGAANSVIVQLEVETIGGSNPVALSNVYFNKAGTTDLSRATNVKIWYTKGYSDFNIDSALQKGVISSMSSPFSFSINAPMHSGSNYFWISYDIGSNAQEGDKFDVDIDSVRFSNQTKFQLNGNPSGYQQVSDTMWMKDAFLNVCRAIIYDDGGPDGDYTPTSRTLTLYTKSKRIYDISFREFDLAANGDEDFIRIYSGDTPFPSNLLVTYSKSSPPSGTFTTLDSMITIEFSSSNAITAKGFEMDVACRFDCNAHPIYLTHALGTPVCEGGLQKLQTQVAGNYLLPIQYSFTGSGFLEFDSVKTVFGTSPDTSFYLWNQSIPIQNYVLTALDSNECTAFNYVFPIATNSLNLNVQATVEESCPYDSTGSISISPTVSNATYTWTSPFVSTSQNLTDVGPGLYQLHIESQIGCKDTSVIVDAFPYFIQTPSKIEGPEFLDFNPGTQIYDLPRLPNNGNEEIISARTTPIIGLQEYLYAITIKPTSAGSAFVDSTSLEVNWDPDFSGEANLYLQFEHIATGCRSLKSIPLVVSVKPEDVNPENAQAPEAFSPNGDGKNDYFVFKDLEKSNNKLFVYNREGVVVYEKVNYQNDWDGTFNGDAKTLLPDGTYYYVLKNENQTDKFKGFVEIRR
jgi:gliding motility-associated-like protein